MQKKPFYSLLSSLLIFIALFYFSGSLLSLLFSDQEDSLAFELSVKGEGNIYLLQDQTGIKEFDKKTLHLKETEITVDIRALGQKNPLSYNDSIWLWKLESDTEIFDWRNLDLLETKGWNLIKSQEGAYGWGLMSSQGETGVIRCQLKANYLKLYFLAHEWNGLLEFTVNGEKQLVDTYMDRDGEPYGVNKSLVLYEVSSHFEGESYKLIEPVSRPSHFGNYYDLYSDPSLELALNAVHLNGESLSYELLGSGVYRIYRNEIFTPFIKGHLCALLFSALLVSLAFYWFCRLSVPMERIDYVLILSLCSLISLFLSSVFSPGILTVDGMVRWMNALALLGEFSEPGFEITDWFPLVYSSLMAITYKLSGGFTLMVFLQAFLFYSVIAWMCILFCGKRFGSIVFIVLLFLPPISLYSVYNSNDVIAFSLLGTLACIYYKLFRLHKGKSHSIFQLLSWFVVLLLLLFRNNCLALIPVFILFYCWACSFRKKAIYLSILATIFCVFFARSHTAWLGVERIDKTAMIYLWEHIQSLKIASDDELTDGYSLDDLGFDTKAAIVACNSDMVDNLIFFDNPSCPRDLVVENGDTIRSRFFNLVKERPFVWIQNKALIYKELLGFGKPMMYLKLNEFSECEKSHFKGDRIALSYERSLAHPALQLVNKSDYLVSQRLLCWIYKPWCLLLLCFLLLSLNVVRKIEIPKALWALIILGLSYYGSFFILTPAVLFRYYFVSFILLLIACAALFRLLCFKSK